jgi:hypothetical protein
MAGFCTRSFERWPWDRCSCRWGRLLPSVPLVFAGFFLLAGGGGLPLDGQTIQGQILDRDTELPVEGALVLLLDLEGRQHRGSLSNATGRFLLRAPGPGRFRVRAERIGFETVRSDPFELASDQVFGLRLTMAQMAIELEGIRVEGSQRCVVRPEEGLQVARVWEEARKALALQAWTEQEDLFRFRVVSYERDLDPDARLVESETRRAVVGIHSNPIRSLPPEELAEQGFVRRLDDGGWEYFGPDAQVLLSDAFLDTHCFRLALDATHPTLVGLAFEPVRRRGVPDIAGTLWLDRQTAHLRFLEYRYTWSPWPEMDGVARGRVEFEALPGGAWIVRRWWIRMPRVVQDMGMARRGQTGIRLGGIREAGGEVSSITSLARGVVAETPSGILYGVVWDSTRYRPLEGAMVHLSGTQHRSIADSSGRFLMQGLPGGTFTASFTHPRLDTLGIQATGVEAEILPGEASGVSLGIPSTPTILASACTPQERPPGTSVLVGVVRGTGSSEPLPRAQVEVRWSDFGLWQGAGRTGRPAVALQERQQVMEALTDAEGRYRACGVPAERLLVVQARFLDRKGDTVHIRAREDAYAVLDLEVPLPPGLLTSRTTALSLEGGDGVQGVQGWVRERGSGNPVRSAEVILRQAPGHVVVRGVTDDRGFFRLRTPLPGAYALTATALGYAPASSDTMEVEPGKLRVLELEMPPEALELPPLVVVGESRAFHLEMQGFYQRRNQGLHTGFFFSPEDVEKRRSQRITDLLWGIPRVRILEGPSGSQAVYFQGGEQAQPGGGSSICGPKVYLDRLLVWSGGTDSPAPLREILSGYDLEAMEVYRTPAEIPPEFGGAESACGVILLWSRAGGGRG